MSKNAWIIITLVAIVILILGGSWLYFSKGNQNKTISPYSEENSGEKSKEKSILLFNFPDLNPAVTGIVDNEDRTISLIVPLGTDLKNLTPAITISEKASISPSSGQSQDFTSPVIYRVTAEDGSTQDFTVNVVPETEGQGS